MNYATLAAALALLSLPFAVATPEPILQADCSGRIAMERPLVIVGETSISYPAQCTLPAQFTIEAPRILVKPEGRLVVPSPEAPPPLHWRANESTSLKGQDGGHGSDLRLVAARIELLGSIALAAGASGQDVLLDVASATQGGSYTAIGGNGGNGGRLLLEGIVVGSIPFWEGPSGDGGSALVQEQQQGEQRRENVDRGENGTDFVNPNGGAAEAVGPDGDESNRDGWNALAYGGQGGRGAPLGGNGGTAVAIAGRGKDAPNATLLGQLHPGGRGGTANAFGGHGGLGLQGGGSGGSAVATAGDGGRGGDGLIDPADLLGRGADGGNGGHGGWAMSAGGRGGPGNLGGRGGDANSTSGTGGQGGNGLSVNGTGGPGGDAGRAEAVGGPGGELVLTSPPGAGTSGGPGGVAVAFGGNGGNGGDAVETPGNGGNLGLVNATGGAGGSGIDGGAGGGAAAILGIPGGPGRYLSVGESATAVTSTTSASPRQETPLPAWLAVAGVLFATASRRVRFGPPQRAIWIGAILGAAVTAAFAGAYFDWSLIEMLGPPLAIAVLATAITIGWWSPGERLFRRGLWFGGSFASAVAAGFLALMPFGFITAGSSWMRTAVAVFGLLTFLAILGIALASLGALTMAIRRAGKRLLG